MKPKYLLINGSRSGKKGNSEALLRNAEAYLPPESDISWLHLAENPSIDSILNKICAASAMIIGTGTYWDSWGSPLQRFLEDVTSTESTEYWIGKPVGVIVSMHSVGGKSVLSRLQGVLNNFGALLPPMSGMVYSTVAQALIMEDSSPVTRDLWCKDDIRVVVHNLVQASQGSTDWMAWPVDREHGEKQWVRH